MLEERRLCTAHFRERSAAIAAAQDAADREASEERAARAASRPKPRWINVSEAPARLRAAGIEKVDVWGSVRESVTKRTWYGRKEKRWDPMHFRRLGSGWFVGELDWDHPERWNMGEGTMRIVTVVVDPADWDSPEKTDRGCVPLRFDRGKYTKLASSFHLRSGVEGTLSDRILRLLGE